MRNRHFVSLWFVNVASTFALELFTITVLVSVFQQTESTLQAAATMVARTAPALFLGPVAGVLVDRLPRKNLLFTMDLSRATLICLAIWLLQGGGKIPVAGVYFILTGLATAEIFHRPARLALIPALAPPDRLVRANSFMLASNQIIVAVSYTVGGWLILAVSLVQIALLVIALYILAALAAMLIHVPRDQETASTGGEEPFVKSVLSGWQYLNRHPIARSLAIMETAEHLPHGIWTGALMLAFTAKALQGDASDWGYQVSGYFAGMIVGSLGALSIGGWLQRYPGRIIVFNAFFCGVLTLAYAGSPTVWAAVVLAFVFGPPFAMRDVAQDSLLQATVAKKHLGRVYATQDMLRNVMFMCAGLFFAWLSDFVPIRIIYVAGGLLYLLTGLYALGNKALRESKIRTYPDTTRMA